MASGAYAAPGDFRNIPGGAITAAQLQQRPAQNQDPNAALLMMARDIKALRDFYVTPLTNVIFSGTLPLATATIPGVSQQFDSGSNPVCRITLQCFTGAIDFVFGTNADYSVMQLFTIPATLPAPFVIPWPNIPLQCRIRNRDTLNAATFGILISSAGA